jgi:hypothetical protein
VAPIKRKSTVDNSSPGPVLTLLPEVEARALLAGRELSLRVLRPPYPALGLGVLRVLRVSERGERTEIVAGYEGYERLGEPKR